MLFFRFLSVILYTLRRPPLIWDGPFIHPMICLETTPYILDDPLVFWADPLCFDTTPGFSPTSNYSILTFYLLFSGKSVTYLLLRSLVMLTVVSWTPQDCAVGWFSKSSSVKTLGKKEFRISAFSPSVSTVVASGRFKSLTPIRVLIFDLAYLYNALGFFHIQKIIFSKVFAPQFLPCLWHAYISHNHFLLVFNRNVDKLLLCFSQHLWFKMCPRWSAFSCRSSYSVFGNLFFTHIPDSST